MVSLYTIDNLLVVTEKSMKYFQNSNHTNGMVRVQSMLRKNCISEVTVERSTHKKCNNAFECEKTNVLCCSGYHYVDPLMQGDLRGKYRLRNIFHYLSIW